MVKINPISDIKTYFKINKINLKIIFLIVILLSLGSYLGITFGRYVFISVKNSVLSSKNFFFNSDKMSEKTSVYQLNNWSGAEAYSLIFNMNSLKNNAYGSNSDINYDITMSCSSNVICSLDKTNGTIYMTTHQDSFTLLVTPNASFKDGDKAVVEISATSSSPYVKTLKAKFTLVVGKAGLSYELQDVTGRPYLEVRITNTLDYYEVKTAFDSYAVGDRIDVNTYQSLSADNKNKCASAIINLKFNPSLTVLDMTSKAYLKGYNFKNETIDSVEYLNEFSFKMDALSSETISFYKLNVSKDYTYPIVNPSSIITVSYS